MALVRGLPSIPNPVRPPGLRRVGGDSAPCNDAGSRRPRPWTTLPTWLTRQTRARAPARASNPLPGSRSRCSPRAGPGGRPRRGRTSASSYCPARCCSAQGPRCSSGSLRAAKDSGLSWPVLVSIAALVALAGLVGCSRRFGARPATWRCWTPSESSPMPCASPSDSSSAPCSTRASHLALVPLAFAGAFAGAIAVGALIMGDVPGTCSSMTARSSIRSATETPRRRSSESRSFPPSVSPPRLRSTGGCGVSRWPRQRLCLDLFLLAQSRASAPALLVGLVAYCIFSPLRVRALSWLALAVLPALGDPARDGVPLRRCG